jgi:flavorubredoxin
VRFSDNHGLIEAVHRMLLANKTRMICPAHGNVITDLVELTALMERAFLANGVTKKSRLG